MSYSCLPALHDWSSRSYLWVFSLRLHPFTNVSFVDSPNPLTGHSNLLHTICLFVHKRHLTCVLSSCYLRPTLPTTWLQVSVPLCAVVRSICPHLHKVPGGPLRYILRTEPSQTDGHDASRVIRCVAMIVVFGIGTQLPRRPVMTPRPKAGAGGGCYLVASKFMWAKLG